MTKPGVGRKTTPLPIYVSGASGRHAPRKKPLAKRTSRSRSGDDGEPSSRKRQGLGLSEGRTWKVLWALLFASIVVCMVCLATLGRLVQTTSLANNDVKGGDGTQRGLFAVWKENQVLARLKRLSHMFTSVNATTGLDKMTRDELRHLGDYECLGWRQTTNCTPTGRVEPANHKNCTELIPNGVSGYCEVRHVHTGKIQRVLAMHCNSLRPGVVFQCAMFQSLMTYSILSTAYEHDANFSFAQNHASFRATNQLVTASLPFASNASTNATKKQADVSFDRGIVFVIYEKVLLGAYVSVRSLRAFGCTLPIEMWYKTSETNAHHPLLQIMVAELGVYLRIIDDPMATHFYTKLYAIFYSAFDSVLLLDADNFAVRDPTYLFDTPEFVTTGAIFWPDFWKPGNTIFNIHRDSFVWDFFGLEYVDMFEQESGQVMINRRMHYKALNVLMYYGFALPRAHEELHLVWGDKDLFRFAWLKSNSTFYMTERPPGAAGTKHPDYDLFCGVTMVQHDPSGHVIFMHRNTEKLTYTNNRLLWTHIQDFKQTAKLKDYFVRGANGGKVFPQFKRCFGKDVHYDKLFTLKPMSAYSFEKLEDDLLRFAAAGADVLRLAGYKEEDDDE